MHTLQIPRRLYDQILDTIGAVPTESGGVFGVSSDGKMETYYFDVRAGTGKRFYRPSAPEITTQVNEWLCRPGLHFGGYIHSHPPGLTALSPMDLVAAEMTMFRNGLPWIYMLILCEERIFGYRIVPRQGSGHGEVETCAIRIT